MIRESQPVNDAASAVGTALNNDMPTLKKGSKSEGVRFLQQLLILHYQYNILFDAVFGNKTENAVKDFQTKHNLVVDGIVGVHTWRALGANIGN